jgi:hypothetical protein
MCSLWIVYYKHKFIIAIHFFLSLDLFWINSPLNDIKYQLCYLKWCLYTQKFYLWWSQFLFLKHIFLFSFLFQFLVKATQNQILFRFSSPPFPFFTIKFMIFYFRFKLIKLVVIGTDYISSCISNYQTITTTKAHYVIPS